MDTQVAHSVGELVDLLRTRISRDRGVVWFRGHRVASWEVSPGIWRDRRYAGDQERNFTNRFSSRAATRHQSLPQYRDVATWLVLMQHYGLPTRLLDWTRSPLMAVYFAVEDYLYERISEPEEAVIWVLDPHSLNESQGPDNFTPSIEADRCRPLLEPAFTNNSSETGKILAVMAAEKDARIIVQQGCFTIHSDRTPLEKREDHRRYLSKITLPVQAIHRIALEIDICGFRKGDVYPDLTNLATELKCRRNPG
jgi:hypothetical protein